MNQQQEEALRVIELYAALLTQEFETAPIRTEQRQEIGYFLLEQVQRIRSHAQKPVNGLPNLRVQVPQGQGCPAVAIVG